MAKIPIRDSHLKDTECITYVSHECQTTGASESWNGLSNEKVNK